MKEERKGDIIIATKEMERLKDDWKEGRKELKEADRKEDRGSN